MAEKVIEEGQVSLNSEYYNLVRGTKVTANLASLYPPKITIGDVGSDSDPRRSVITWNDFRGGLGLNRIDGSGDVNRIWFGTVDTQHKGHLVKGPLLTATADPSLSGTIPVIDELNVSGTRTIFAAWAAGVDVRSFNNGTDSWGSSLNTLPDAATDALNARINGTETLIFAHFDSGGSGFTFTTDGSAFTANTTDAKYLAFWDDRMWAIDDTGQLWYWPALTALSNSTTVPVNDAQLQLPDGYITNLFVGRDAAGEKILYAATQVGLYAHDAANARFIETDVFFPQSSNGGKGSTSWKGDIYIAPAGTQVLRYNAQNGTVIPMGLDRDHGLPDAGDPNQTSNYRGDIEFLIPTHNELIAVVSTDAGVRAIYGWGGLGWRAMDLVTADIEATFASFAYSTYRLWYSHGNRVRYFPLESDLTNPLEVDSRTYTVDLETVEFPWFDAGQPDIDKLALRIKVEVRNASSSESVQVMRSLNYGTVSDTLVTITSNGVTVVDLPDSTTPKGEAFRQIQISLLLARGSTDTKSPDITSVALEYRKKITAKWAATFTIDLGRPVGANNPQQQLENLITAIESNPLVEFTYRDPDKDGNATFFVDVQSVAGLHRTGRQYEGDQVRLSVVEV